ncbi:c-type cytochrome [Sphingomonas sp. R-74633]|uniref:c-type cytochrome n=1 Tax=Sphingomonas sp. R-74633 TaxID=2751188 RepID=UPI0015D1F408|nr:c-type cytochrome [Sphingomonas sp. R-74633]NYT40352.1 c-type cytochrome [Sphingomonas sp. R-74633]
MRIVGRVLGALVAIVLVLMAVLYGGSQWVIGRSHAVPLAHIDIPRDAASIAEGGRLATIEGCRGCHGPNSEGLVWSKDLLGGTIAPPAIARKIASYSDDELVRLIRHGVKRDGSALFIMSTGAHRNLADDDLAKIIAWLRTLKPGPKDSLADTSFGPMPRFGILTGGFKSSVHPETVAEVHRPADVGRYFYKSICADCHLLDKTNTVEGETAPALAPMAASYDAAAFKKLLRTGVGMSKPNLGLMSGVAKESLHALSDDEIAALQTYLKGEADKQMAGK